MLVLAILKKLGPYLKYIIGIGAILTLLFLWWNQRTQSTKAQQALDLYKRQVSGQLSEKEHQLEAANSDLGLAQSKMLKQDDLLKSYQNENIKISTEFEKFKK